MYVEKVLKIRWPGEKESRVLVARIRGYAEAYCAEKRGMPCRAYTFGMSDRSIFETTNALKHQKTIRIYHEPTRTTISCELKVRERTEGTAYQRYGVPLVRWFVVKIKLLFIGNKY